MDGRGGCCIARYAGYGPYDLSKVNRIMLRFRPIAPKPASDGGGSTGGCSAGGGNYVSTAESSGAEICCKSGRGKRKYRKENSCNSRRCYRRRRSAKSDGYGGATSAVTLSLLPETPDRSVFPDLKVSPPERKLQGPFWVSFGCGGAAVPPYQTAETALVSSCVTVERVTDTWVVDGHGLGGTDEERKVNLERDTCPGFISDGLGRVTWTNEAYRKMVRDNSPVDGGAAEKNNMIVRLVMKERPMLTYTAFTCRVGLRYASHNRESSSVTVPCDVWRMDGGGFAWRLDVKAALCL